MRAIVILLAVLLVVAGCDSPHPRTKGFEVTKLSVEGSDFSVRSNGEVVEAIRTNYAPRRDFGRVLLRAVVAMELATGCVVDQTTVKGDPALMAARIDC
ncbi:hypothetical protein AB9F26_10875 [Falsihalocynthiibacter sp. BN13B15]|uniref:hypothetical protein n=1 Tax=Falsihalocynthiibacter sp. BN13B15 TaxID=3240871 RepID=UPI00351047FF